MRPRSVATFQDREEDDLLKGFRDFVARGNVVDLAVGIIIGAAFGAIVESLVKDLITPVIGMLGGQPDFSAIKLGSVAIGNFINAIITFLIKAAALYLLIVVPFNRLAAKLVAAPPPSAPSRSEILLAEILAELKAQKK
jgi:large conductance mechanosensitive channel